MAPVFIFFVLLLYSTGCPSFYLFVLLPYSLGRSCLYATDDTPFPASNKIDCDTKSDCCFNKFSRIFMPAIMSSDAGKLSLYERYCIILTKKRVKYISLNIYTCVAHKNPHSHMYTLHS